ncbi:helix-turn-helix domain-containing protein [Ferruginibacter profundus]
MKLYIKNMVCPRCMKAVEQVFKNVDVKPLDIHLGEVLLKDPLTPAQLQSVNTQLQQLGFELLDDNKKQLIEKIKSIVIEHIHYREDEKFIFSEVVAAALHKDYSVLSKLFSETEGITIEQYVIQQKIERVKELLVYNEMNLNEIAFKLNYSSVAHLSAQFKKVTGLTPSQFKAQDIHLRKSLDGL